LRKIILGEDMELKDSYGQFTELHLSGSGVIRQAGDRSPKPHRSCESRSPPLTEHRRLS
jgi:hypothetical protein